MLTFQQFAEKNNLSLRHVRRLADQNGYKLIVHKGIEYHLTRIGRHANNQYDNFVVDERDGLNKKHLSADEKLQLKFKLERGDDPKNLAVEFGISIASIYRVKKNTERKVRADAGEKKYGLPPNAKGIFESAYLSNAQHNARLAYEYAVKHIGGIYFPYRYALEWANELKSLHSFTHYASKFESEFNFHIRRDLWAEFEFMQCVVWDVWKADDWVIYKGKDVQPRVVVGVELKTGIPVTWKAFPHEPNGEDINSVMLEFVFKWGVPETILLDNGREFKNEQVLRFVSGWWDTEQHERKRRIIFSEAYNPRSKGRLERLFKIMKDEHCAFSAAYSPNPKESRKPTLQLSHVKADKTLKEFCAGLDDFMNNGLLDRQRTMWFNNNYTRSHAINENRPRTMREAVDRCYSSYEPRKIESTKLAFLYAKKFTKNLRNAAFKVTYAGERFMYLPDDLPFERFHETFDILLDPVNVGHAYVCDLKGVMVCEAWDLRYKNVGLSREQAAEAKKYNYRIKKAAKHRSELINDLNKVAPSVAKRHIVKETVPVDNIEESLYGGLKVEPSAIEMDSEYQEIYEQVYSNIYKQTGDGDEQFSEN
jgi:hypothetical protein